MTRFFFSRVRIGGRSPVFNSTLCYFVSGFLVSYRCRKAKPLWSDKRNSRNSLAVTPQEARSSHLLCNHEDSFFCTGALMVHDLARSVFGELDSSSFLSPLRLAFLICSLSLSLIMGVVLFFHLWCAEEVKGDFQQKRKRKRSVCAHLRTFTSRFSFVCVCVRFLFLFVCF
jgi:hypothetical protein